MNRGIEQDQGVSASPTALAPLRGQAPTGLEQSRSSTGAAFYTASRATLPERSAMWRRFRDEGVSITSSWIDEAGEGETECFTELWDRIVREIAAADRLVLYAETGDFPLKGALIEAGIAMGMGKPVTVCLPGVQVSGRTHRPVGSWIEHQLVTRNDDIGAVLASVDRSGEAGETRSEAKGLDPKDESAVGAEGDETPKGASQ